MSKLIIDNLYLRYGATEVLKGIDARFEEGSVVCLLGQSGSGKTTLLRAIAGLEQPSKGSIRIDGTPVYDEGANINIPPEKRGLGFVFQSYALWPHKTVFDNVAYALKLRSTSGADVKSRVAATLEGVGLGHLGERYPHQLSGGQQQRVAIARALVYEPPVILLDEPLSNLDAKLREEARIWIRSLIKRLGLTAVFVTHDQLEAMAIADQVVLLEGGRLVQSGSPEQLYNEPVSFFASEFMGSNNVIKGKVLATREGKAQIGFGKNTLWGLNRGNRKVGDEASAVIRVERVGLADAQAQASSSQASSGQRGPGQPSPAQSSPGQPSPGQPSPGQPSPGQPSPGQDLVAAELDTSVYLGSQFEHVFRCDGQTLRMFGERLSGRGPYWLRLPSDRLWVF